jgi:hypothetical protein
MTRRKYYRRYSLLTQRDEQIVAIRRNTENLISERLEECYSAIKMAYDSESIIGDIARLTEVVDRSPSGFRVLSNSETRHLTEFNDPSYHWDHFCKQLGRSVAHGERTYLFEVLENIPPRGQPIEVVSPTFARILDATVELSSTGYNADVICVPISLFVAFMQDSTFPVDVSSPRETLDVGGGQSLSIIWSSGLYPLDRIIVFDSSQIVWRAKRDPSTGDRLTIAIGEPPSQPNTVRFIAETVVECEIADPAAVYSISVDGEGE